MVFVFLKLKYYELDVNIHFELTYEFLRYSIPRHCRRDETIRPFWFYDFVATLFRRTLSMTSKTQTINGLTMQ